MKLKGNFVHAKSSFRILLPPEYSTPHLEHIETMMRKMCRSRKCNTIKNQSSTV